MTQCNRFVGGCQRSSSVDALSRATFAMAIAALVILAAAGPAHAANVVGGWDLTRGGVYSISQGSQAASLRTTLSAMFPGTSFTGTSTLTPAYLSTVDTVILTTASSDFSAITPLTSSEQTALRNFVLSGHRALLMGERSDFSPAANQSLINPFGLNISGSAMGHLPATAINNVGNPILDGPYGLVGGLTTINPGWFDVLGGAQPLAQLDFNSQPILAWYDTGALGPGSGALVLSADSDLYTQNPLLIVDTFAFLIVPEPSGMLLAIVGAGSMLAFLVLAFARRS